MDMSQPAAALLDQAASAEAVIARARSGAMPLQELMSLCIAPRLKLEERA